MLPVLPDAAGRPNRAHPAARLGHSLMAIEVVSNGGRRLHPGARTLPAGGETPQLFPAMAGLWLVHTIRGELQQGRNWRRNSCALPKNKTNPPLICSFEFRDKLVLAGRNLPLPMPTWSRRLSSTTLNSIRSQAFPAGLDPGC